MSRQAARQARAWITALLLAPLTAFGQIDPDDLLPVEQAFALSARMTADERAVRINWDVADGYYLYRHAFRIEPVGAGLTLAEPEIPAGQRYADEFFGEVEIYRGGVEIVVPVEQRLDTETLELQVGFQGCADLGVCYPPQRQSIELPLTPRVDSTPPAEPVPPKMPGLLDRLNDFGKVGSRLTGRGEPLPAEQAFIVEAIALGPGQLLARFTVHPDYYLYRDSIEFESGDAGITVTGAQLPEARPITDEYFGDTFVYYGEVEIPVSLARPAGGAARLTLTARFQGCQTEGICYPPMERALSVSLPEASEAVAMSGGKITEPQPAANGAGSDASPATTTAAPDDAGDGAGAAAVRGPATESEQDRLARFITEQPLFVTMLLFVLLGIGLAFTPCVFPMIPILSGIIAGEGDQITRGRAFALSLVYVLAMALTYTAVGVVAALMGYNVQAAFQNPWVLGVFALIFVLLALAMFGFYNLQLPSSWQAKLTEVSNRQSGGKLLGAGIMGFFSALIVGPCVTAPLIGILIFISQTGDAVLGGSVLFALSIGMGLPLLAIGIGMGHWLPRAGGWMEGVKAVFGVGLLALAIWMLERILPGGVTMLLWGILAIASGVYLGALNGRSAGDSGWTRLWQSLGVVLLLFGAFQLAGSAAGGKDWLRPLQPFAGSATGVVAGSVGKPEFTTVENLGTLNRALASARQPVFLDFYADWCVDCKRMERTTFPDPAVSRAMQSFDLLKIDMTDFDAEDQQVLNAFGLHGPPAYLFFNNTQEMKGFRMYGFMSPDEFLAHLEQVGQAAR